MKNKLHYLKGGSDYLTLQRKASKDPRSFPFNMERKKEREKVEVRSDNEVGPGSRKASWQQLQPFSSKQCLPELKAFCMIMGRCHTQQKPDVPSVLKRCDVAWKTSSKIELEGA